MELQQISKWLFIAGIAMMGFSLLLFFLSKLSIPLGKLPGDISIKSENSSFHFPIISSLVVSIILTLLINLFIHIFRK